ncbi:MAG: hypothetical protein MJZ55_04955 [Paludibacteraceae bacterium]|nr:hypothetical protein [Paludibacteraceae bacterium]
MIKPINRLTIKRMNNEQKQGLWTFLLEILRLIFTIGSRHVEKHNGDGE